MRSPLPALRLLSSILCLLIAGCATPIAPSGGPQDTTPPRLESADPADAAVNVRADRLVLTFSENVDETTVPRALNITPGWETPPEVRVRRRRVEVVFPDSLRPHTTYVVTFDTNLRDLHNIALREPITLAFATGPQLDRGQITGRILDPQSGAPVAGLDVFAYALADTAAADSAALPDPRTTAPDYRTQTGEAGTFTLGYLTEGPYFVVAIADANRNRRADAGEAFAAPSDPVAVALAPDSARQALTPLRAFRTRLDTIPPEPLRVRTRSDRRFAVRFDEPIRLRDRDTESWSLVDTTTGRPAAVRQAYADDDLQQLVLLTDPLPATPHRLRLTRPTAVADSTGNPARPVPLVFTPSPDADTLGLRFLSFLPEASGTRQTLSPLDTAGVRFNAPADSAVLGRIAVTDTLGAALPFAISTADGIRYRIAAETDAPFRIAVPQPDSTYVRTFAPLPTSERGDLAGVVVTPDGARVVVEAVAGAAHYVAQTDATGAFMLSGLPAGEVRLRLFVDRNGNGRWDGGRLAPYVAPEPLRFLDSPQTVRARWETVIDTLVIE